MISDLTMFFHNTHSVKCKIKKTNLFGNTPKNSPERGITHMTSTTGRQRLHVNYSGWWSTWFYWLSVCFHIWLVDSIASFISALKKSNVWFWIMDGMDFHLSGNDSECERNEGFWSGSHGELSDNVVAGGEVQAVRARSRTSRGKWRWNSRRSL